MRKRLILLYYTLSAGLMFLLSVVSGQLADPDLWGRLSVAALIFRNRAFPYRDVFSYTAWQHPWMDHEWLSGVCFYLALLWGGEVGLHFLKYGVILATFALLFSLGKKTAANGRSGLQIVFWGLFLLSPVFGGGFYATVRAQIFSLLFFTVFIWLCEQVRIEEKSKKTLWWLLPVGVFWGNAHGGFVLGLLVLFLYGAGQALETRRLKSGLPYWAVAAALFVLIGLCNPYGIAYWSFLLHALTMTRPNIPEWRPLPLVTLDYWPTKLLMVALAGYFSWLWARRRGAGKDGAAFITPALVLAFCVLLTLRGVRFQPFLGLAAVAYLPGLLSGSIRLMGKAGLRDALPGLVALLAAGGLMLVQPFFWGHSLVNDENTKNTEALIPYPVGVVRYLQGSPWRGNLLNPFTVGEFLYWNLYPRFKIAWDGRYEEVYSQPEFAKLYEFYGLPHSRHPETIMRAAAQSPADFILIEVISPNQPIIATDPAWQLLYSDWFYFLYGRKSFLAHAQPYAGPAPSPERLYTIQDFFRPADLEKFQVPAP